MTNKVFLLSYFIQLWNACDRTLAFILAYDYHRPAVPHSNQRAHKKKMFSEVVWCNCSLRRISMSVSWHTWLNQDQVWGSWRFLQCLLTSSSQKRNVTLYATCYDRWVAAYIISIKKRCYQKEFSPFLCIAVWNYSVRRLHNGCAWRTTLYTIRRAAGSILVMVLKQDKKQIEQRNRTLML